MPNRVLPVSKFTVTNGVRKPNALPPVAKNRRNKTRALWESRAWSIYNALQTSGEPFTANYLQRQFQKENKGCSFLHLSDLYLIDIGKYPKISPATRENYTIVRAKVADLLTNVRKQPDLWRLLAVHFGKAYIEQYRKYMAYDLQRKNLTIRRHSDTIKFGSGPTTYLATVVAVVVFCMFGTDEVNVQWLKSKNGPVVCPYCAHSLLTVVALTLNVPNG